MGCPINTDANPASMMSKIPAAGPLEAELDLHSCHKKPPHTWGLKEQNLLFPTVLEAEKLTSVSQSQKSRCQLGSTLTRGSRGESARCLLPLLITVTLVGLWSPICTSFQSPRPEPSYLLCLHITFSSVWRSDLAQLPS